MMSTDLLKNFTDLMGKAQRFDGNFLIPHDIRKNNNS